MPVYEAAYRKWERGAGAGRSAPTLAILSVMSARVLRLRFVKLLLLVTIACACFFSFLVFYVSYDELLETVRRRIGLEGFNMLHFVNQQFLIPVRPVAMLLAAMVGTPLIAEDRRARALALYFSRPITHFHYVAGKFLTVAGFLSLLVLLPPICFYLVEVLLSTREDVAAAQLSALARSLVPGLVLVAMFASVSLGVSSLLRRTTYAGLAFLGTVTLAWMGAEALAASLRDPSWYALSPLSVVIRIGSDMLPIPDLGGRMSFPHFRLRQMDAALAWSGAAVWTAGGLAILSRRVRNIEVVS